MNSSGHETSAESLVPAWIPSPEFINTTNLAWLMRRAGADWYEDLHRWSVQHRETFWALAIERLSLRFDRPFERLMESPDGVEAPQWLKGARLNIVESCFSAPADSPAILYQAEGGTLQTMSVGALARLTDSVAAGLHKRGFKSGDALAILMPMTAESVAIYLGIVKAGCVAVGIADSFRPKEIATRLRLARTVAVFAQDVLVRDGKTLPLYANLIEASALPAIVLPAGDTVTLPLRPGDEAWGDFLKPVDAFPAVIGEPGSAINILFSSGTTGDPKAIPWTHTTPIKCATDAHFHHNVQAGDVLVWPTNLGWMMGPWLIFAALLNRATLGLYYGAPTGREFGEFVQNSKATLLGVVPSLVRSWRASDCMRNLDWNTIRVLSSTGECSNAEDMRWLMSHSGGAPVIEYCGGTEIGGGYITGAVTRPCVPGAFNAPALGSDFVILNESGQTAITGELFLIPPSVGLSNTLLNQDHYAVYFEDTPKGPNGETLRRHGDQMQTLPGGYWRALGRADDTMNLGGIKISSAEIERALQSVPQVTEVAAIAVTPTGGGPSQLVIYAVNSEGQNLAKEALLRVMQQALRRDLNPLFKIHDLVFIDRLPRTASNKVMRRALRGPGQIPG